MDKNQCIGEKCYFLAFFSVFLELLAKFRDCVNSDNFIGKITSNFIRIYPVFVFKKHLKLVKNREIQVNTCMIIFTRSSGNIFNPMLYTGNIYTWAFYFE